ELALAGQNAVMAAIERTGDAPYAWQLASVPLAEVANAERTMPREFISEDGFGITEAAVRYLQPLIEGEDYPRYRQGLPVYATLKNTPVPKKLPAFTLG